MLPSTGHGRSICRNESESHERSQRDPAGIRQFAVHAGNHSMARGAADSFFISTRRRSSWLSRASSTTQVTRVPPARRMLDVAR